MRLKKAKNEKNKNKKNQIRIRIIVEGNPTHILSKQTMQVTKIKLCNLVPFGSLAQEEEGKGKQKI